MKTTTRILRTSVIKELVKGFKDAGYDVEKDAETVIVRLDGSEVFRALIHSSGKNYLARYDSRLLTESKV